MDVSFGLLGGFFKDNPSTVCFSTAAGAVSLNQDIRVSVGGLLRKYLSGATVVLPALSAGTDYAIYACSDGTLQASANFSAPSGYTTANSRRIGGFHYAPGGNATGYNTGGDTTPAINPYSLWDLKWRPACPDPRGMVLVANSFWCDIYLCGTDVDANGSSRYGVTIADGSSPPKIPVAFGGTGSTSYTSLTRWEAGEVLASVGKDLLTYSEFAAAAYGVSEHVSRGNDPNATGYATSNVGSSNADNKFTSKWGVIQAAGCLFVWGREFGGPYNTAIWENNNGGRGQTYLLPNAALFGANWSDGLNAGSRASRWSNAPSVSHHATGARGRSDHLSHV